MNGEGRERRERGTGRTYQRGNRWWIEYWHRGKQFRESASKSEGEAKKKLKARLKEIAGDRFVGPDAERMTVEEMLDNLLVHLRTKGARSVHDYESHLKPVREYFALGRAVDVTTSQVEKFIEQRLASGKARATVNRETGALVQAFNLARRQGRLVRVPHVPMLKLDNARSGFFERAEFDAVASHLPEPINEIARFGYLTGWRKGEILPLRWDAVDRQAREVRLRTSKNGHGRLLPLDGELWELIERRWAAREYTPAEGITAVSAYVFHRSGQPFGDFKKSWASACKKANVPGRLFHDLRRTAARDMIRAGVPQSVVMSITGHRTVSMFLRYNITSGDDMREAIRRTSDYRAVQPATSNVVSFPTSEGASR